MFVQPLVALSFVALSFARALPIEKRTSSKHWWSGLEPYSAYHQRYMELDCENQHNTSFFDQCCHPRLKNADLSKAPEQCLGSADCDDENDNDNQTSKAPMNVAPAPTSSDSEPTAPSPTPTTTHTTTHHTTAKPSPTSNPGSGSGNSNNVLTGNGKGTFFYQNGVAGACGTVHSDSSKVVALDSQLYGNTGEVSKYCGKTVHITNTDNGKSVDAVIADACPTCVSEGSIDMSVGAFTTIASEETGEVNIKWEIYL